MQEGGFNMTVTSKDMTNPERKKKMAEVKVAIKNLKSELEELKNDCDHTHRTINGYYNPNSEPQKLHLNNVTCDTCDRDFGWYCPESNDGVCIYVDSDVCCKCGQPAERK